MQCLITGNVHMKIKMNALPRLVKKLRPRKKECKIQKTYALYGGIFKLKSPETRQVQERWVSALEHLQVPKIDRTRCPDE